MFSNTPASGAEIHAPFSTKCSHLRHMKKNMSNWPFANVHRPSSRRNKCKFHLIAMTVFMVDDLKLKSRTRKILFIFFILDLFFLNSLTCLRKFINLCLKKKKMCKNKRAICLMFENKIFFDWYPKIIHFLHILEITAFTKQSIFHSILFSG